MNYSYFADTTSLFFIIFLCGLVLRTSLDTILDWMNSRKTGLSRKISKLYSLSNDASRLFPKKKIYKALNYKTTKDNFSDMVDSIMSGVMIVSVLFGFLPFLLGTTCKLFPNIPLVWCWIITSVFVTFITTAVQIPVSLYNDFHIEKKFGFNTKTKKIFITDTVKCFIFSILFTIPVTLFLDYLLRKFGNFCFLNVVFFIGGLVVFGKIFEWFYMNVIIRLFNTFKPLKDGNLKNMIEDFCKKNNFKIKTIEIMDASKRTTKQNAFVCGTVKKRIVLFDTLFKTLSDEEIFSILTHEIGHAKLHHILITNIIHIIGTILFTVLLLFLIKIPDLYHAFGYSWVTSENISQNYIVGLSLVSTFLGSILWIFEPIETWLTRKNEYAADRYGYEHINPKFKPAFKSSLLKLTSDNLSDLFPNKIYESINYTHPSILNRIKALNKLDKN